MTSTIADLIDRQAKVYWRCSVCEQTGPVDLNAILAVRPATLLDDGPVAEPWGSTL